MIDLLCKFLVHLFVTKEDYNYLKLGIAISPFNTGKRLIPFIQELKRSF